jgi:mRNA interferase MazF
LNALTIAPITRTIRSIPTEVVLEPAEGVKTLCAISLDNIFTIPREALGEVITVLNRDKILLIFEAIRRAFDMP